MLINVGGSYEGEDPDVREMNIGRFELRVNVTDKGHIGSTFNSDDTGTFATEEGGNPSHNSDFIISLSENGIIIAGMKADVPMVIRNDGQILIESTSSDVILKGVNVKHAGPKGERILPPPSRPTDTT